MIKLDIEFVANALAAITKLIVVAGQAIKHDKDPDGAARTIAADVKERLKVR